MPTSPFPVCKVGPNCASQSQWIPTSIRPAHINNMSVCQMLRLPLGSRLDFTKPTYVKLIRQTQSHNMLVNQMQLLLTRHQAGLHSANRFLRQSELHKYRHTYFSNARLLTRLKAELHKANRIQSQSDKTQQPHDKSNATADMLMACIHNR